MTKEINKRRKTMIEDTRKNEEFEEKDNIALSEIVENEEDKKILEPVKKPTSNGDLMIGYVNTNIAYLRKEADNHSLIVYILKKNDPVLVDPSSLDKDFYLVTIDCTMGYVSRNFITLK